MLVPGKILKLMVAEAVEGIILSLTPALKIVGSMVVWTTARPGADCWYIPKITELNNPLLAKASFCWNRISGPTYSINC